MGLRSTAALVTCALLASHALAGAPAEAPLAEARAAVKALGESLKSKLVTAIKAEGPVSAIAVCKTVAPVLAEEVSKEHGLEIRRTALRVRNPANAPDQWERSVLEDFVAKIATGAHPAALEHIETVPEGDTMVLRYMKAIPTAAEPCLACHGSNLDPALKAEIARLYPNDQATNFKAGELRGAFTVTIK